jgi:hypothetical protein
MTATRTRSDRAIWAASLACALALGFVIVRWGPKAGLALVLLPLAVYVVMQPRGGLLLALAIVLAIPYWWSAGPVHWVRVAWVLPLVAWLLGRRPRLTWIDVTLALFLVISALGWYLQEDQAAGGKILFYSVAPLTLFLAARAVEPAKVPFVMAFAFIAGTVGALTVLYEAAAGHLLFGQPADTYYWNASAGTVFRPGGVYGSPPVAAAVLAMTALCGLPVLRSWRGWKRVGGASCMLITFSAMVSTLTRAPLIGFAAGLVVYLVTSSSPLLRPTRVVPTLLVVVLGALVLLPSLESTSLFQRGVERGGTLAARVGYWQLALPIVTASPHNLIFGIGTEAASAPVKGGPASAALAESPVLITVGPHNQYVLTLLEEGIIGLAALIGWLLVTIVAGLRASLARPDPFAAALPAAVIVVAVALLADATLFDPSTIATLGVVTGLIIARGNGATAAVRIARMRRTDAAPAPARGRRRSGRRVARAS